MENVCNINGSLVPEAEATVSVLDRGFLFGDSVYEVVRTVDGVPFAWPEHWQRLHLSAEGIALQLDLDEATVARRVAETMAAAGDGEHYVRVIVTRGTGSAPNIDLDYAPGPPTWVVMVRPAPQVAGRPAKVALVPRLRNDRRALDPAAKSGNYLNNVLGLAEAKQRGATDCIMLNRDGSLTEASTSNLFVRLDGTWCTPPLQAGILAGITRGLLLQWLTEAGTPVAERDLTADDLRRADEMFLSSTLRNVGPVTHLDDRELCGPEGGPSTRELMALFDERFARRMAELDAPRWRALQNG